MTREELLSALNIAPEPAPGDDLAITEAQAAPVNLSPTALDLDDWSIRRGREVLTESELLQAIYPGDENQKAAELPVADFLGAAFEPEPKVVTACTDERRHRYMRQLLETPDYQALHSDTQLDDCASEIAAAHFAQQWVTLCQSAEPENEFQKDLQALRAASQAIQEARQDVGDLREAQTALGLGSGSPGLSLDAKGLTGMFKRVRGSRSLKRICELAGRYRRFAQAQQRKKCLHGQDDVVGVVLDGDPGRLLPHELAALDDPDLELDTMRRIVERQAMCREYRGLETKARGPICVVVDESGSMGGEPIYNAKAIALALAWVARHQGRWCCLVGFSGGEDGNFLVLPPGKWDLAKLMEWLEHFYGNGTDCNVPLVELPARWDELGAPKGKTDIIIITDAIVSVPDDVRQSFLTWKAAEKVKLYSLVLNSSAGDLAGVSDKVYLLDALSLEAEGVGDVLSV